ncbi:MAG: hypothetical protein AB7K68_12355 [Bacteriovoracia bacterium]
MLTAFYLTQGQWQHFERRDFPALCGFVFFLYGLGTNRRRWFSLAGILLGCSWIYSIDRGIYLTAGFFGVLGAVAVITRNWKEPLRQALLILLGWTISFLTFGFIFGFPELAAGIRTTMQLFAIKDLSDGSVYPPPAFPISNWKFLRTTHTFPLVCLAIQLLAFFSLLQKNKWRLTKDSAWLVQLSLLLVSLAYYRGALSRCDEVHYRYVSSFAFLGAALVVARAFCESALWRLRSAQALLCLAALSLPAQTLWDTGRLVYGNAKGFPGNIREFLRTKDEAFLPSWQIETAAFLAKEFREEKCFASLVSEPLWIYLLKKPHCGRFHLAWLISDKGLQLEAIEELKHTNPGKILVHTPRSGDEMDGVPIEIRARYLYGYVAENYRPGPSFKGWEVWVKK